MRKIPVFFRAVAAMLAISILITSCASTTMIQSDPSGAKIYLDGEPMGKTPYTHTDTKITGTPTQIKLVKEGYEDFHTVMIRNEEVDVGAIVGGVFFLVPFLWVMKYKPMRTYELTPAK
ncbi:MAG: PEGA domain-containing protein [Bacteroidales bacterium]